MGDKFLTRAEEKKTVQDIFGEKSQNKIKILKLVDLGRIVYYSWENFPKLEIIPLK